LTERQNGRKYEEGNVISYKMTIRKMKDAVIYKRKRYIAHSGELALEEVLGL